MLDEREGDVPPGRADRAFNRKPLWQRAAIVAAGPAANLLLAVVLYSAAHWIGVDEPKALLGPPAAASLAERAGLRAGDWVRAWSPDGIDWHDVRSITDLRWEVTQSMLHGDNIDLLVSDARRPRPAPRRPRSRIARRRSEVDAKTDAAIGLGNPWQRAGARRRQGRRRRRRGRAEGGRPRPRRSTTVRSPTRRRSVDAVRASGAGVGDGRCTGASSAARHALDLVVTPRGRRRQRHPHRPHRGLAGPAAARWSRSATASSTASRSAVTQTWQMSALTVKMLGKMIDRPGLAQEPERAGDDRRLRRPVGAARPGLLPRLSRRGQRQSRRAQPAAAAGPRWRPPDVLSFRGRDGTSGLRVVARQAAAWRGCHHAR